MWSVLGFLGVLAVLSVIQVFSDGMTGYGPAVDGVMSRGARLAHELTYVFSGIIMAHAMLYFFF